MGVNASLDPSGQLLEAIHGVTDRWPDVARTLPRTYTTSAASMTSGTLRLTYFTALYNMTSTNVAMWSGSTAAAATPTLVRIGLYEADDMDDLTLVASTPNDTSLFAAATTRYAKDWSASYDLVRGGRYAVGLLVVSGTTVPSVASAAVNGMLDRTPRLAGVRGSQADLPSVISDTGVADGYAALYAELT